MSVITCGSKKISARSLDYYRYMDESNYHTYMLCMDWGFRHHTFVVHLNLVSGVNVVAFLQMFLKMYEG